MNKTRFGKEARISYAVICDGQWRWAQFIARPEAVTYLKKERRAFNGIYTLTLRRITRKAKP